MFVLDPDMVLFEVVSYIKEGFLVTWLRHLKSYTQLVFLNFSQISCNGKINRSQAEANGARKSEHGQDGISYIS